MGMFCDAKVAAEALRVCSELVLVVRSDATGATTAAVPAIFGAILARLQAQACPPPTLFPPFPTGSLCCAGERRGERGGERGGERRGMLTRANAFSAARACLRVLTHADACWPVLRRAAGVIAGWCGLARVAGC